MSDCEDEYKEWLTSDKPNQLTDTNGEYSGELSNELYHGYGVMKYQDGSYYRGNWVNGKKEGYGIMKYKSDGYGGIKCSDAYRIYEGYWINDFKQGYGVETHVSNVSIFSGNQVSILDQNQVSIFSGNQVSTKYEGEWFKDAFHGYGTFYQLFGYTYKGNWIRNKMHGDGEETYNEYSVIYKDKYTTCADENVRTQCIIDYENAMKLNLNIKHGKFVGTFRANLSNYFEEIGSNKCKGVYYYLDGSKYEYDDLIGLHCTTAVDNSIITTNGMKKGKHHGYGVMKYANGTIYTGQWLNGNKRYLFTVISQNGEITTKDFK